MEIASTLPLFRGDVAPVATAYFSAELPMHQSSDTPLIAPTRVLLVSDDRQRSAAVQALLRLDANQIEAGPSQFSLDCCLDFSNGLELIARDAHDVILVETGANLERGLDFVRAVNAQRGVSPESVSELPTIEAAPLILLVETPAPGEVAHEIAVAATRAGAADCLSQNGLSFVILSRAIGAVCAGRRAQKKLRDALTETRRDLEMAQKLAHFGSWTLDLNPENPLDEILVWSDETFRILGLEPQSVVPTRAFYASLVLPADLPKTHLDGRLVANETEFDSRYRIVRPDGQERTVRVRALIETDSNGAPRRVVGTIVDLTERQRAESHARATRRHLQLVMQSAPIMIWAFDAAGIVTFVEGHALQSLPDRAAGHVGRSIFEIYDSPIIQNLAQRVLAGEECGAEVELGDRSYDVRYNVLLDDNGALNGAVGMAYDITERRAFERALRDSQQRLHAVIDTVPILIWAIDREGIFTLSQGRALQFVGLQTGEAVGQSIFALYGDDTPVAHMARRVLGGETGQEIISVGDHDFEVHYSPTRDENGAVIGAVGVSYGVTDRVSAQRELERSEARFNLIVANASGMVYRFHRDEAGENSLSFISEGCREIYGLDADFIRQHPLTLFEVVYPSERQSFAESILTSQRDLSPWQWEGRITRPDGETRWIRGQSRPVRQEDGSTVWDGIIIDITRSRGAQEELLKSRRALDEAQKLAHIGSFEWNLESGEIRWSDEMFRIFGFEPQSFTPTLDALIALIAPAEREALRGQARLSIQSASPESIVVPVVRTDGALRWLQTHTRTEVGAEGRAVVIVGSAQDITESRAASLALRDSEQRYALAAQGANDGLWDWDLVLGRCYFSPRWKAMLGFAEIEIGDGPGEWLDRVHPEDIERLRSALQRHFAGETHHFECEYRIHGAGGELRWMLGRALAVLDENGAAARIVGSQTDITERKLAEAQLSRNAFYDKLTGLPNRTLFLERLESTLAKARRNPQYAFATLFLDIDRFKKINDSLGHLAGDQLLIEAAARFSSCLRPDDTVARLGGDEFALLVDDIRDQNDVTFVASRIQQALSAPFVVEGKEIFVTVSIGIAPFHGGEATPEDLLRNADSAMYRAKGMGRARFETFDATMHQRAVRLLELETDLWRAIERDELCLHFQPIVSLRTGFIHGTEALLRWNHPTRGLVSPADFIPIAEENGLIVPLGWWVLREACRQSKLWGDARLADFPDGQTHFMSVNVSSAQFSQPDLLEQVAQILAETGADARYLTLEITESVIMEHSESASAMLRGLKAMGLHLSMDDFGTGYSSLSFLHRFPLDTLKIDRSFISQMRPDLEKGARDGEIVGTILALADSLKMKVVAEGVETAAQLAGLRHRNCGFAQGYLFSKPLPAEQIQALWQNEPRW